MFRFLGKRGQLERHRHQVRVWRQCQFGESLRWWQSHVPQPYLVVFPLISICIFLYFDCDLLPHLPKNRLNILSIIPPHKLIIVIHNVCRDTMRVLAKMCDSDVIENNLYWRNSFHHSLSKSRNLNSLSLQWLVFFVCIYIVSSVNKLYWIGVDTERVSRRSDRETHQAILGESLHFFWQQIWSIILEKRYPAQSQTSSICAFPEQRTASQKLLSKRKIRR